MIRPDPNTNRQNSRPADRVPSYWFAAARRSISDLLRRAALRDEIAELDRTGRLDTVLDDIGVTRWELNQSIRSYPEAERLLPAMAERLSIDLDEVDPRSRYTLQQGCALCAAHRACRRWLNATETAEQPKFCPNAELFAALRGIAGMRAKFRDT